jgi:hypothetical protein
MPIIEIVAYTPLNMDKFIDYCLNGKPDGMGGHYPDPQGRKITGVFDWLRGRGVPKAHFFHTKISDEVNLFAATIQKPEGEDDDVPWMGNLPGLEQMITVDGRLGKTGAFASLSDLLATVTADTEMDDLYNNLKDALDGFLEKMRDPEFLPTVGKQRLLAALRGEVGANTDEVFEEIARRHGKDAELIVGRHRLPD